MLFTIVKTLNYLKNEGDKSIFTYIMYIYGTDGFMKKYLLLRNNKQTGPYTSEELLEMGLKAQDLLWMEGKSAAWRYPGEFDEFKTHPSVLQDAQPDRLFTDVQNLVFHLAEDEKIPVHHFPDDELIEFPTMARFMDLDANDNQETTKEKITSTGIIPVESGIQEDIPEIKPIFEEPVSIDIEKESIAPVEESIDTVESVEPAIISADKIIDTDIPAVPESTPEAGIETSPEKEIPAIVHTRVSVTLPAAVSDHTFVVIHPKELDKAPLSKPEIEPAPVPVAASLIQFETENQPEIIHQSFQEKNATSIPEKMQTEEFPVIAADLPEMKKAEAIVPEIAIPVEIKKAFIEEKTAATEQGHQHEQVALPNVVYIPVEQADSGNLIQKLAVAAGIISLIGVAGLIANSIFNPDAYNYSVNTKPVVTQPVSVAPLQGTQESSQQSGTETAVPSNTTLQEPLPDNTVLQSGGVKQKKENTTEVKSSDKVSVPSNAGNQESNVNTNAKSVSNEEKPSPVDPKEEARKHITKLVQYELNNYKVNAFGGVSDFEVVINNNSAYPLDLVVVELKYIQSNKKVFKTETLEFKGIAPKGKQSIGVAKTNRGIKVETTITSISSRELDLSYHQ